MTIKEYQMFICSLTGCAHCQHKGITDYCPYKESKPDEAEEKQI